MTNRHVRTISAAVIRRYGPHYHDVVAGIIDRARDRQRWDKMVLWSRVLCRTGIMAGPPSG